MDLLGRLIRGEEQAFAELYSQYWERVYSFVKRFVHTDPLSRELTQRVFIRLWERRHKLSEQKPFEGQLFVLARNLTIDHLRQQAREQRLYDGYQAQLSQTVQNTEEAVILTDLRERAERVISDLPERRQEIFRLSREEGLSYPEIAQRLGISPKTVEAQMSKALATLRAKLRVFMVLFF